MFEWCLPCGESGLSDVVANVLLFVPFAAGLSWSGVPGRSTVALGLALSVAVEMVQLQWLVGRDATISDIVANTLGSFLGLAVAWWLPVRRRTGPAALVAAVAVVTVIAGVGGMLHPSFPNAVYYGQWTDDLGMYEHYRGRVLSADVGDLPLPSDRLADSRTVQARLERGVPIRIRAIAGPRPTRFAPIFGLSPGVLRLGPDGDDLVLQVRTRAVDLRLRQPDLRWRGAMAGIATGDTVHLEVSRAARGFCVTLDDRERCGLAYGVGQAWALVAFDPELPVAAQAMLGCLFMAILGLPVGLVFRRSTAGFAAVAIVVAGVLALPALVGLAPTPPSQLLALAFGAVCAALMPPAAG